MYVKELVYIFLFLFGAAVGSFLNCFIYRLKKRISLGGSSFCPSCKHKLSALDLIPVFSYLFLKGRCRYCGEKISLQYPSVEITTAVLFVATYYHYLPITELRDVAFFLLTLICFSLLIVVFVYDLKHYVIPNEVMHPLIFLGVLWVVLKYLLALDSSGLLLEYLLAPILAFSFFFLVYYSTKGKGMGFGDVRLSVFMGLFLGVETIVALFVAFLLGALIGIALIVSGKKGRREKIPFGPFLVAGTFLAFFLGEFIMGWYFEALTVF